MPVFWIRIQKAFEYVSISFSLDIPPLINIELMLHFCVTTSLNFKQLSLFLGGSLFYFTSNGPCAPTRTLDATEFRHIIPLRTHSQTVDSDHSTNCNWKLVFPSTIKQPESFTENFRETSPNNQLFRTLPEEGSRHMPCSGLRMFWSNFSPLWLVSLAAGSLLLVGTIWNESGPSTRNWIDILTLCSRKREGIDRTFMSKHFFLYI